MSILPVFVHIFLYQAKCWLPSCFIVVLKLNIKKGRVADDSAEEYRVDFVRSETGSFASDVGGHAAQRKR